MRAHTHTERQTTEKVWVCDNVISDKKKSEQLSLSLIPEKTVEWNLTETTVVRIIINIYQHDSQNLNLGHLHIILLQSISWNSWPSIYKSQ